MKLRFTIRDLFWLTLVVAAATASIGGCIENFNAGLEYKPAPIPEALQTRLTWQCIVGLICLIGGAIAWVIERLRRPYR